MLQSGSNRKENMGDAREDVTRIAAPSRAHFAKY
jgi:hypothetical protein